MACGKPTMVAVFVVLASKFWKVLPKTGELETDFVTLAVFSCKHNTQIRTKEIFKNQEKNYLLPKVDVMYSCSCTKNDTTSNHHRSSNCWCVIKMKECVEYDT